MSFLDQPIGDLTHADLQRLIDQRVAALVPPIPQGVAALSNLDQPIVMPDVNGTGAGLFYDDKTGKYVGALVDAPNLAPQIVLASQFIAGDPNAAHVSVGTDPADPNAIGIRAYDDADVNTFKIDAQDGSAYMNGRLDFGTGSRLTTDDVVELQKQASIGFVIPARVQSSNIALEGAPNITSAQIGWNSPTVAGNTLFMVVTTRAADTVSNPVAPNVPTGWTLLDQGQQNHMRHSIFYIVGSASRSGNETVTWTGPTTHVDAACIQMFEVSGIDSVDLNPSVAAGNSTNPLSTATGTLNQAGEYAISFAGFLGINGGVSSPSGGFSNWSRGIATVTLTGQSGSKKTSYVMQAVADIVTTATTSLQTGYTLTQATDWIEFVITFKARAAGTVQTPQAGRARLYAGLGANGESKLHEIDDDGAAASLLLGPANKRYRVELATASITIPSTAGNTVMTPVNVSIPSLAVGDMAFYVGTDAAIQRFILQTAPVCTTAGTIVLNGYNADPSTRAPTAFNFYFLVIHLS